MPESPYVGFEQFSQLNTPRWASVSSSTRVKNNYTEVKSRVRLTRIEGKVRSDWVNRRAPGKKVIQRFTDNCKDGHPE